jgi:hypothetical protein
MVIFIADLPCSFVIIYISRALPEIGYAGSLLRDGAAFLLIGTIWWFAIGVLIREAFLWLATRWQALASSKN